jgi:hypothetical protein
MVKGLDLFRERLREFEGSFTLIGGAACDEWFTAQGLPFRATRDLDIVLKAHAWLNLTSRQAGGADVDSKNIAKHRNDVFRLAGTLPGDPGPELPESIKTDLVKFLGAFPENSTEWPQILGSLKNTFAGQIQPAVLRSAIQTFSRMFLC